MKRVAAISKNEYLLRKIELTVSSLASITTSAALPNEHFDICLWDIDTLGEAPMIDNIRTMSAHDVADIRLPLEFRELIEIVTSEGREAPLVCSDRYAYLRGEKIKLTELEAALLARLIEGGGKFVERSDILRDVWNDDADAGIVNVYIHYLREKLEKNEKIIISSRSLGYKIDEKYLA